MATAPGVLTRQSSKLISSRLESCWRAWWGGGVEGGGGGEEVGGEVGMTGTSPHHFVSSHHTQHSISH